MNPSDSITALLSRILDVDPALIHPKTYVIRDLNAESIDLLEIAVSTQHDLGLAVDDDIFFLKDIRVVLNQAKSQDLEPLAALQQAYAHLAPSRVAEILADLPAGPVLQVRDLVAYVQAAQAASPDGQNHA